MRFLWILLIFFTSCTQLQDSYRDSQTGIPASWKNTANDESPQLEEWWVIFDDSILNDLIAEGIENNRNAQAAYQRMLQAYYQAKFRLGTLSPLVTLAPIYFKQGSSVTGFDTAALTGGQAALPTNIGNTGGGGGGNAIPSTGQTRKRLIITDIDVPLNFRWELDLWGKLTQHYLNAYYQYESAEFDSWQTLNQITSDIAVNYYLLRGFDTELEVLNRIILSRKDNLDINKVRYEAGLINYLDVTRAEVDYNSAKADRENVFRERELQVNILAALIGRPASELELPFSPLSKEILPPLIPTGIPSELLTRRPDVLSSMTTIKAYYAEIGVAYAEFFPDLTISGAIGYSSNKFKTLFDWQSRLWQIAASIMQIIYDGGRLQANLNQTVAAYAESVSNYEETVLIAFKEVEDALINIRQREKQDVDLNETVIVAQDTYNLAKSRYDSGLINYLDVVIAERDLLNYSRSAAIVHSQRFVDTALLVKALGGGWDSAVCLPKM